MDTQATHTCVDQDRVAVATQRDLTDRGAGMVRVFVLGIIVKTELSISTNSGSAHRASGTGCQGASGFGGARGVDPTVHQSEELSPGESI